MLVSAEVGVGWVSAGMTVATAIMTRRVDREGEVRPPHGSQPETVPLNIRCGHRPAPEFGVKMQTVDCGYTVVW